MTVAATTRFTASDQRRFSSLSGDRNPVHLDPLVARRVAAGEPIVHGVHLLLRMLERRGRRTASAVAIEATFLRPAFIDEPIAIVASAAGDVLTAHAAGDVLLAQAAVRPADAPASPRTSTVVHGRAAKPRAQPTVRSLADIDGAHGVLTIPRSAALGRAFPSVARAFGADVVAAVAAVSPLVGMECPGRDSLLSALRLRLTPGARIEQLAWRVSRVDRRFGFVRIDVSSDGVSGSVDAFLRPPPVERPTIAAAAGCVGRHEFAGQRALIVGGSRGLGAATALLIAAGGGAPIVTYAAGAAEATALRREIRDAGGSLDVLRLDVNAAAAPTIVARAAARHDISHLYYFASPRIFARRQAVFDEALFERFTRIYVGAFSRVCTAACRDGRELDVFYPSTVAIADVPAELTEYAAAKAAGESVCVFLERSIDGLHVLVSRLPRVTTDQTASIVPAAAAAPIEVMLPIVRDMQRRRAGRSR